MGYQARGGGEIYFDKEKVTPEQIKAILDQNDCGCYIDKIDYEDESENEFYVEFDWSHHYRDDLWYDFLELMNGLLECGNIEFIGEDDSLWRFNYRNGKWYEDNGRVEYEDGKEI